jgi:iron complex outermembrane receptor protein
MIAARALCKTIASILILTVTAPELADAAPGDSTGPDRATDLGQLEEITVTATRREASTERVPISLTALTSADLASANIKNIADVAAATPGLQFSVPVAPSTITTINIRGINTSTGPATVGVYLDDTPLQTRLSPLGNVGGPLPLVNDLNRVEVARGPQGTLFGAGSEGGTVRFIVNDPSVSQYSGAAGAELSATQGGQPSYEYGAAGGGPVTDDSLGLRVSAWKRRDGGYIDLVDPLPQPGPNHAVVEPDANRDYEEVFRMALKYKQDGLSVTPSLYYQSITRDDSGKFYPVNSDLAAHHYADATFLPEHSYDRWWLPSLKIEFALPFADLTFVSSYLHRIVTVSNDFGDCFVCFGGSGYGSPLGGDVPISTADAAPSITGQRNVAYTEELHLSSLDPTARVSWVGGLFFDTRTQQDYQNTVQLSTNSSGAPVFIVNQNYKDSQLAAFGQADIHVTQQLTATAGLRAAHDSTNFHAIFGGAAPGSDPTVNFTTSNSSVAQNPLTPRFVLSYQVDPDDMVYTSATKGYRVGGGNAPLPPGCEGASYKQAYGSDWIWNYELGAKDMFFGNRLQIDTSAYHMVWSHIQQLIVAAPCGITYVGNVGAAAANGFDLGARAVLTSTLRLDAKVSYTNAYYTESVYSGSQPTVLEGDKIGFLSQVVSPWTADAALEYKLPLGAHTIHFRAEDQYNSRNPGPFQNGIPNGTNYVPLLTANPATNLANLRVGDTTGGLDVSIFVNNVFNTQPLLGSLVYTGISSPYRLADSTFRPRTVGVAVNYAFAGAR